MKKSILFIVAVLAAVAISADAQIEERVRPAEWDQLVPGGRFADRFLPMKGEVLSSDTWGAEGVVPRFIDNGMEDRVWSYWGGNIVEGDDGKYHLMACGWLECSEKGHYEWGNSYAFNAIGDEMDGPFKVRNLIGKGHNPEVYRLKDGRWVLYVIDGYYVADDLNGTWQYGKFDFDPRDRGIIEGLSNLSFVQRQDGSYLMVCRGGGIWASEDGISGWKQITDKRVYPPVDGRFEDPVIWRDAVQYHMIVNDWLGRIAYYLRSPNGVDWVVDPGEAYMPGIAVHEDGLVEDWFKFERIKVFQDAYGRAIQANFAVIDVFKWEDKSADNHSSKNICIPLNPGLLLEWVDADAMQSGVGQVCLKIKTEEGFDPASEVDVQSLRFGDSKLVNFGGGSGVVEMVREGDDLVVSFDVADSGIDAMTFAPKLIGKRKDGRMLFAYLRNPDAKDVEALVSARRPKVIVAEEGSNCEMEVEVENFGLRIAKGMSLSVRCAEAQGGRMEEIASGAIPDLAPYQRARVSFPVAEEVARKVEEGCPLEVVFSREDRVMRSELFPVLPDAPEDTSENP